jgi:hypothetical protein
MFIETPHAVELLCGIQVDRVPTKQQSGDVVLSLHLGICPHRNKITLLKPPTRGSAQYDGSLDGALPTR